MDYENKDYNESRSVYSEEQNKTAEEREAELFAEKYSKQNQIAKKVLKITFCSMGAFFALIGSIAGIFDGNNAETQIMMYVFVGIGALFILLGLILTKVIPDKVNYDKYKAQINFGGGNNIYSLSVQVQVLTEQVHDLQKQVDTLNKQIEILRDGRY